MKVGFIGLGRMGQAMARRLLDAGHDVAVYNRTAAKTEPLARAGAKTVRSIAEAARYGEAVITMLSDDPALEEVAQGKGGLIDKVPPGGIHLCCGTHGIEAVRRLTAAHERRGQLLVTGHVFGRPEHVAAGQVSIVIGGKPEAVSRCRPLLTAIGRRTYEAGHEPAAATVVKLANNFVLGCAIEAMGEAIALVRKLGLAPDILYDVMTEGLFAAPAYKVYGRMIIDQAYHQVGQRAVNGLKDAELVLAAGELAGVPLPSGRVWRERLAGAVARGEGEMDWAVMALEQARASGLA
jgi:3-hydroxyisobutyrate dehydrogenase-like beta-hydroxyacid dehydrogenase